jgi:hypothetical protein
VKLSSFPAGLELLNLRQQLPAAMTWRSSILPQPKGTYISEELATPLAEEEPGGTHAGEYGFGMSAVITAIANPR